jgi:hypothetical protein
MKKWKIILAVYCRNFLVKIGKSVNFTDFIIFYNIRLILKFSFQYCLMNDIKIFLFCLKQARMILLVSSLLRLFLLFKFQSHLICMNSQDFIY